MFKRFSSVTFSVLLGIMSNGTMLQALYFEDLWEDIWKEEATLEEENIKKWLQENVSLGLEDASAPEEVAKMIIDRLSGEDKCNVVTDLFEQLDKIKDQDAKKILRLLCEQTRMFDRSDAVFKDAQSVRDLKAFFEEYVKNETHWDLTQQKLDKMWAILRQDPIILGLFSGTFATFLGSCYFSSPCYRDISERILEPLFVIVMSAVMREYIFYYQPNRKVREVFNKCRTIPYLLYLGYCVKYICTPENIAHGFPQIVKGPTEGNASLLA